MSVDRAIGVIETRGMTGAIAGTDAMVKAAHVEVVRMDKPGSAYVAVLIRGDVASVKAALDAGAEAAAKHGDLVSVHVIASPHPTTTAILDLDRRLEGTQK